MNVRILSFFNLICTLLFYATNLSGKILSDENFSFSNFRFSYIEKNNGTVEDTTVKYFMRSSNATVIFKKSSITYQFIKNNSHSALTMEPEIQRDNKYSILNIELAILNSNSQVQLLPDKILESKTNYFIGNDSTKWKGNQPNFGELIYSEIYELSRNTQSRHPHKIHNAQYCLIMF